MNPNMSSVRGQHLNINTMQANAVSPPPFDDQASKAFMLMNKGKCKKNQALKGRIMGISRFMSKMHFFWDVLTWIQT
jgi:hypothetical protein